MKKYFYTAVIFILFLQLNIYAFGGLSKFGSSEKVIGIENSGSGENVDLGKYDKVLVKLEAIKLIQLMNSQLFESSSNIQKILVTLSEKTQIAATDIEQARKDCNIEFEKFADSCEKLDGNQVINSMPEKKPEDIAEFKNTVENDSVMIINQNILDEFKNERMKLLEYANKALLLNAGVFFIGKTALENLKELTKTVKDDAKKDLMKGAKYVVSVTEGVKLTGSFISQTQRIVSDYYKVISFAKFGKAQKLELEDDNSEGVIQEGRSQTIPEANSESEVVVARQAEEKPELTSAKQNELEFLEFINLTEEGRKLMQRALSQLK